MGLYLRQNIDLEWAAKGLSMYNLSTVESVTDVSVSTFNSLRWS